MSRAARTRRAAIPRSPTTPAATGIARSARLRRHADGWPSAKPSCCRCRTFMSSTRCQANCVTSPARTSASSTNLLMKAAAETTLAIAADPKRLGARIGIIAVLHSWGSALTHHPHLHMIVPGGGLSFDGARWVASRSDFLVHINVLARLFRGKMLAMLMAAHDANQLTFFNTLAGLADKRTLKRFIAPLRRIKWVVYCKAPFAGPEQVLRYLSRYTHRVAISNRRLVAADDGAIAFRWKDYRVSDQDRWKTMRLHPHEFIRRFLMHVLPKGFHRIRQYGLFANANRAENIATARALLNVAPPAADPPEQPDIVAEAPRTLPFPCRRCGGRMIVIETFAPGCEPRWRGESRAALAIYNFGPVLITAYRRTWPSAGHGQRPGPAAYPSCRP